MTGATSAASAARLRISGEEENEYAGLLSIGALFYDPLWIFYRRAAISDPTGSPEPLQLLTRLKGLRVNLDQGGSGVLKVVYRLFQINNLSLDDVSITNFDNETAADALCTGEIDAMVFYSARQSKTLLRLLSSPGIGVAELVQATAITRRLQYLHTVTLPRGMADFGTDNPDHDIQLLAATTALVANENTHPALRHLMADAAQKRHSRADWFSPKNTFPNIEHSEITVAPEGVRAIKDERPFYYQFLPFWIANLIQRMGLLVGGIILLMLPLSKIAPSVYRLLMRWRIFREYAYLRRIEECYYAGIFNREEALQELSALYKRTNQIVVPTMYDNERYTLRNHIYAVSKKIRNENPLRTVEKKVE